MTAEGNAMLVSFKNGLFPVFEGDTVKVAADLKHYYDFYELYGWDKGKKLFLCYFFICKQSQKKQGCKLIGKRKRRKRK
jgi:hypothetical protein